MFETEVSGQQMANDAVISFDSLHRLVVHQSLRLKCLWISYLRIVLLHSPHVRNSLDSLRAPVWLMYVSGLLLVLASGLASLHVMS